MRGFVLDHNLHLKRVVAERQEEKKEVVRRGCLKKQDRIERDFEYDGDDEYAVGKDWWTD